MSKNEENFITFCNELRAYVEEHGLFPPKHRGYYIIDKVAKDGLLFVGINPSFDESNEGACQSEVRKSDKDGYKHKYFIKPRQLNDHIGLGTLSHVDMFSISTRHQYVVRDIVNDPACRSFVDEQLRLFRKIVNGANPRVIVVINAMASSLIKNGCALGPLAYDVTAIDVYFL